MNKKLILAVIMPICLECSAASNICENSIHEHTNGVIVKPSMISQDTIKLLCNVKYDDVLTKIKISYKNINQDADIMFRFAKIVANTDYLIREANRVTRLINNINTSDTCFVDNKDIKEDVYYPDQECYPEKFKIIYNLVSKPLIELRMKIFDEHDESKKIKKIQDYLYHAADMWTSYFREYTGSFSKPGEAQRLVCHEDFFKKILPKCKKIRDDLPKNIQAFNSAVEELARLND